MSTPCRPGRPSSASTLAASRWAWRVGPGPRPPTSRTPVARPPSAAERPRRPHRFKPAPGGPAVPDKTDAVMELAKRRGFLWPSYEVYGGAAGFYDYGPLGAAMKKRFEDPGRHVFAR